MNKLAILLTALTLFSCAVQVKTLERPETDFDQYHSWCWLEGCEVTYQGPNEFFNQETLDEIANAIAFNMHEKGYSQQDDQSDLLLNFVVILKEDSVEFDSELPVGSDMRPVDQSWILKFHQEYYHFLKGSLVIDVIDRSRSELVWRSQATKYLEITSSTDRDEIWEGVSKAMKKFPDKNKD